MSSELFTPIHLRGLEMPNRIVVAPMCQYSAADGTVGDWHIMHLGQFAVSGVGLLFVEATATEAEGRITPGCVGLYSDENEAALKRVLDFCNAYGNSPLGIQLAHAGRKASCKVPWKGGTPLGADDGAWQTVGPSAEPYADGWHTPEAMTDETLERVRVSFVEAAKRAVRMGFRVIELHNAHGYLLHQFLSPLSNKRNDAYGGSLEGRMRYPLEIFEAVRAVVPDDIAVGVRISASDWVEGGWDIAGSIAYTKLLKAAGCDFIDVSSGGNSPKQEIPVGPGYQTHFAADIRRESEIPVMAVGKITDPVQAEHIVKSGQADMVALARGMLYDPHWAWHAAEVLRANAAFPPQYQRSHPALSGEPVPGNPPSPEQVAKAAGK
ncbi:NADH:flavin oxidoreductase/NADH oxidase [Thalassospiraceae bacterium LMO-JJ14]|nr:NADH:flavin oxidoreductase/NADH oxidase [Thalassospiraceae bacterium LMO-JJ14]